MDALRIFSLLAIATLATPHLAETAEPQVYGLQHHLNMGNPGEENRKDFYVNAGTKQGIRAGSMLQVFRKTTSYDLINNKIHTEVTFPIATLKVIHAENEVSIARLDRMLPEDKAALINPTAVMVGDIVRLSK